MLHKSELPTSDPASEPVRNVVFPSAFPAAMAVWAGCHVHDADEHAVALGVGNVAFGVGDMHVLHDVLDLVDNPPLLKRVGWTRRERVR